MPRRTKVSLSKKEVTELGISEPCELPITRRASALRRLDWSALIGVAPFFIFALVMMVAPTVSLIANAFVDQQGHLTFGNFADLNTPEVTGAFAESIRLSAASAVLGAIIGLGLALNVDRGIGSTKVRSIVMTFCGVASNFSGVPLAFAFVATLGRLGLVSVAIKAAFGIDIYAKGFDLASFWGLTVTYLFFQIPITITIMMPAIDGLRRDWREAASILGARSWQYWRHIGLPILWPSLLGTLALLFANSFGAIATAYALTGYAVNIVPILLYAQIRGDVLHNDSLGAALALGMIIVMAFANTIYLILRTRAERWLR
ncbi:MULTISPECIES: ABC transporter permease [Rahnella]|jgi:putative spermidine/putrescine transport system permease protein|uniref:Binding-protein-dependent transport systems inner membrane component n=1 Tax=Rahnella sp. (strain Y9602) TaxID=2703885 RepID=A0A0H3FHA8_RAHSY|nr:ABC transporter permease subunit [Rahnella aceris]ADW76622.1 binding-protein-dependent transport systems inner membrane component [Rahnella aceris]MDP9707518.1 putative spermidine/putrescine transport system permease protein [Rahnella aquatilis]UNK55532.1 ABC transporter permease subunit [Rahnella aceris]